MNSLGEDRAGQKMPKLPMRADHDAQRIPFREPADQDAIASEYDLD